MRVYVEATAWNDIERSGWIEWEGEVSLKGEGHAQDQLAQQNALQGKAFDAQQAQLAQLKDALSPYLNGNIGFDPQLMASLTSQFMNNNADQFGQAASGVKDALKARGDDGSVPTGGDFGRGLSDLFSAGASSQAQGVLGLNISNLQQALNNKFNAASVLSGNAATLNSPIATFGSGANNALNQYMQAANSGFGATFMRGLGGSLGVGLGALATGGATAGLNAGASMLGGSKSTFTNPYGH